MNQLKSAGASNTLFNHSRPNNPKKSRFDLSRIMNFTYDTGMIMPIDLIETVPGDIFDIDLTTAIDTLPLVAPSLTQYKFVTHWYYMRKRDLWKGQKTMSTRGRTGNITTLKVPSLQTDFPYNDSNHTSSSSSHLIKYDSVNGAFKDYGGAAGDLTGNIFFKGAHSLMSVLGVPSDVTGLFTAPSASSSDFSLSKSYLPYTFVPSGSSTRDTALNNAVSNSFKTPKYVNALPFVMYQSIVKNNYVNQNLLQNNTSLFPEEGDDDWILPYNAGVTNFIDFADNDDIDTSTYGPITYNFDGVFTNLDTVTRLDQLRYACFDDDYFTTGLPWLQRGQSQSLSNIVHIPKVERNVYVDVGETDPVQLFQYLDPNKSTAGFYTKKDNAAYSGIAIQDGPNFTHLVPSSITSSTYAPLTVDVGSVNGTSSFTLNQLRSLVAMSVWQERNARVNGSYNEMVYQHWLVNPHSEEHQPVYIGGTADYINFNSIVQTSESTSSSPLGSQAGYGSLPSSNSRVCQSFKCEDYGYIMGVMIIKPITYYQQGLDRMLFAEQDFSSVIWPEFQSLSPEPIYEGEIYADVSDSDNRDLFCYQERLTYAKVRQNINRGLFQCDPKKDIMFSAMTQARWFETAPGFSYQFLCMSPDNLRRDHLAYPSMPMFRGQLLSNVYVTRSLAYTSEPETFNF